jgi:formyltetrahydrofolate hydrolase
MVNERMRQKFKTQGGRVAEMQKAVTNQQAIIDKMAETQRDTQEKFLAEMNKMRQEHQRERQEEARRMEQKFSDEIARLGVRHRMRLRGERRY